jgi:hypothetical protein
MAKTSKYNRAKIRSRVRRPKHRRSGSMVWTVTTVIVVLIGVLLIVVSYSDRQDEVAVAPRINDHWHAYLGINVCGQWLPASPEFHNRASETGLQAGLHSHGDGLMHLHPFSSDEAGNNATVGRFAEYGGWSLSGTSMTMWDGNEHKNGQFCAEDDDEPGELQWAVGHYGEPWTGKPRTGNPADYKPKNADIVAVYFLPKGDPLPEPPDAQTALANIQDLGGAPAKPGVTETTIPATTETTIPGASTTTVPGTGTTETTTAP